MLRSFVPAFAALTVVLSAPHCVLSQSPVRTNMKAAIDSLIDRQVAADAFSGAVAVARNGQIVYQRAAGKANRESDAPMTLDTRMQIASATKLFTHIAIRQLEQAGKLSLSDTVGKFLPNYPNAVVRSKVTIEQLLKHRSGVGSFWNERYMARRANVRSVNDYLELFQNDSLLFEPGTNEAYSNGGFVLLGAIIERVSGTSYHDYLKQNVFAPASMTATSPFDRRVTLANAAVGYTTQMLGGPMTGDRRLAGPGGPRPGAAPAATTAGGEPPRLRIMGADGRQLSPEEARAAVARRAASGGVRRPNTSNQPGMSGPAGDHYSTVGDFLRLANAITSRRLLDSAHTAALLGARYASGTDFRANGGGPGVNAEFSIYPSGDVVVVLSNYDPPSATSVAQYIRSLISSPPAPTAPATAPRGTQGPLKSEIESLHAAMVAAFKREPSSVARFYADDASILGGGGRWSGRAQIDSYWGQGMSATDWILEVLEVGGGSQSPWVRGRSTLVGQGGRRMVTDYVGILKRQADGRLKFYVDIFVASPSMAAR